jgi:hypothetical protein
MAIVTASAGDRIDNYSAIRGQGVVVIAASPFPDLAASNKKERARV